MSFPIPLDFLDLPSIFASAHHVQRSKKIDPPVPAAMAFTVRICCKDQLKKTISNNYDIYGPAFQPPPWSWISHSTTMIYYADPSPLPCGVVGIWYNIYIYMCILHVSKAWLFRSPFMAQLLSRPTNTRTLNIFAQNFQVFSNMGKQASPAKAESFQNSKSCFPQHQNLKHPKPQGHSLSWN